MKVGATRSQSILRPVASTTARAVSAYAATAAGARRIEDTISVMGIPPAEMTPRVQAAILSLMQEVEEARRELEAAQRRIAELEQLADLDPLVQMANRRAFVRELSRMISFSARYDIPTSIAYFDLNELKSINDSLGHAAGDAALVHVAGIIRRNIRESDIAGRIGGDEFAAIFPNTTEAVAQNKAASLARIIAETPLVFEGRSISLTVAHGAHSFRPGESADQALAQADQRMYAHKRSLKTEAP